MSLVIDVKINTKAIYTVAAHRLGAKAATNTYSVVLYDHDKGGEHTMGTIHHTSGDGALALAAKALEKVNL